MSERERAFTPEEIAAMNDRNLGSCLAAVVFILGFNVEAALIVKEAAERLMRK